MFNIAVVTPAYQEWENLSELRDGVLRSLDNFGPASEWILIVEAEASSELVDAVCGTDTRIVVQKRSVTNQSFGNALKIGLASVKDDIDVVVIMDGDQSHNPAQIPALVNTVLNPTCECDVAIASRYVDGGSSENGLVLRWMSHVLNRVFRVVLGMSARDLSTNYKAFDARLIRGAEVLSSNFEAVQEVLLIAKYRCSQELRLCELPDTFFQRRHGQSKRKLGQFIGSYLVSVLLLNLKVRRRVKESGLFRTVVR